MLTLHRGLRLGPYEIRAVLGTGGMGQVYRARDTRIGRNVAVKVLNAAMLLKPVLLQRFELEARAAGSLNHPNLLTVHDFGEHQGARYLVTEYLEGETLRERLDSGPVPARKAIDYAVQIARGLSAAHEKGILHRDLKPDNIFITRDGRIKILDFGVAKLLEPETRAQILGDGPRLTAPGLVVGTAQYMSPEQARDLPLDQRSDLFTVGTLLYEILSGRAPFRGASPVEAMTAIVRDDPPELIYTGEQVPGLDLVVHHCLEKSPDNRVQSARDLIFQLETVASGGSAEPPEPPKRKPLRRAALALVLLAAPLAAFLLGRRAAATVPPSFHKLTFQRGIVAAARFAPDAETVVYSALWDAGRLQLFTTRPESPESRSLGIFDAKILSVSHSGELAIQLGRPVGTLARVPIGGGAPRELIESVFEADWAPDGASLAVVRSGGGHFRLEYPAGKTLYETGGWISGARISASGEQVAFIDHPAMGYTRGTVMVVDRAGTKRALGRSYLNAMGLAWAPSGQEIWFTAGDVAGETAVHAVDLRGRERLVMPSTGNLTLQDVSPSGRLLLSQTSLRWALMVSRKDQPPRDLSWMDGSVFADLSEDGSTVLFLEVGVAQAAQKMGSAIYLRKTDGSPAIKLGEGSVSRLSPDGRFVLAAPGSDFSGELLLLPTGSGETRKVPLGGVTLSGDPLFFPDGQRLLLRGRAEGGKDRLFVLDPGAGGKTQPVTPEGAGENYLLSPDGKQLVADDAQHRLMLYRIAGGEPRAVPGLQPADVPVGWTADGSALFVYQPREFPAVVRRLSLATGEKQLVKPLFQPDPAGTGRIFAARVTADGNAFAWNYEINLNDLYLVEGVR